MHPSMHYHATLYYPSMHYIQLRYGLLCTPSSICFHNTRVTRKGKILITGSGSS